MKCHSLFSGKNKKNISMCYLLKFLPRVLSIKYISHPHPSFYHIRVEMILFLSGHLPCLIGTKMCNIHTFLVTVNSFVRDEHTYNTYMLSLD